MDAKRSKRWLYGTLMAVGLTAGAAGVANAATGASTATTPTASATADVPEAGDTAASATADVPEAGDTADAAGEVADQPSYQSSVTVAQGTSETAGESDESATLAPLAKISVEQAKQAALGAVPGTVVSAQLEDENGNVVYGVEVTTASGTVDVKVDAGNANVLSQEAGEAGGES
jgi:uncharacterized membrane protein YkoI